MQLIVSTLAPTSADAGMGVAETVIKPPVAALTWVTRSFATVCADSSDTPAATIATEPASIAGIQRSADLRFCSGLSKGYSLQAPGGKAAAEPCVARAYPSFCSTEQPLGPIRSVTAARTPAERRETAAAICSKFPEGFILILYYKYVIKQLLVVWPTRSCYQRESYLTVR